MKKLDALASATGPDIKKTLFGGIASLLAVLLSIWMLSKELGNFRKLRVSKSLYLDPKPIEESIKVNIDMIFRHSPCGLISLDVHDELNHH